MILGFAHITRNVDGAVGGSWKVTPAPNPPEKWPLMKRHAKSHLIMLPTHPDGVVEEHVMYDTGAVIDQRVRLGVIDGRIVIRAIDAGGERKFLREGLGFQAVEGDLVRLWSGFSQWQVVIAVVQHESAPIDPPLDVAGYAALAFYSTDVEADRCRALMAGGRTPTAPFTVKLDREMKIIMLRSPEGTIIELIEVRT